MSLKTSRSLIPTQGRWIRLNEAEDDVDMQAKEKGKGRSNFASANDDRAKVRVRWAGRSPGPIILRKTRLEGWKVKRKGSRHFGGCAGDQSLKEGACVSLARLLGTLGNGAGGSCR